MSQTENQIAEWQPPYLIHRLTRGVEDHRIAPGSVLTEDNITDLKHFFQWDYMGSAEFEFGAPRQAILQLIEALDEDTFVARKLKVPGVPWVKARNGLFIEPSSGPKKNYDAYVVCRKTHLEKIQHFLNQSCDVSSFGIPRANMRMKENPSIWKTLACGEMKENTERLIGGIDYDNLWLYFNNKKVWKDLVEFLAIKN